LMALKRKKLVVFEFLCYNGNKASKQEVDDNESESSTSRGVSGNFCG